MVDEGDGSETVVADTEFITPKGYTCEAPVDVHALWTTPQPSGRASSSPSPPLSAISFPNRGRASPGGSFMSAPSVRYPPGLQGIPQGPHPCKYPMKKAMCYLCYGGGHFLLDCPRFPSEVRREAAANREAYLQQYPQGGPSQMAYTRPASPHNFPVALGACKDTLPFPELGQFPEWARW
jgi:hypothetical protein